MRKFPTLIAALLAVTLFFPPSAVEADEGMDLPPSLGHPMRENLGF